MDESIGELDNRVAVKLGSRPNGARLAGAPRVGWVVGARCQSNAHVRHCLEMMRRSQQKRSSIMVMLRRVVLDQLAVAEG
jgi:hypothetical protein